MEIDMRVQNVSYVILKDPKTYPWLKSCQCGVGRYNQIYKTHGPFNHYVHVHIYMYNHLQAWGTGLLERIMENTTSASSVSRYCKTQKQILEVTILQKLSHILVTFKYSFNPQTTMREERFHAWILNSLQHLRHRFWDESMCRIFVISNEIITLGLPLPLNKLLSGANVVCMCKSMNYLQEDGQHYPSLDNVLITCVQTCQFSPNLGCFHG